MSSGKKSGKKRSESRLMPDEETSDTRGFETQREAAVITAIQGEGPLLGVPFIAIAAPILGGHIDSEVLDLSPQGRWVDAEFRSGGLATSPVTAEGVGDVKNFDRSQGRPGADFQSRQTGALEDLLWEVPKLDETAPAEHERVFDGVFKLSGVAGEIASHEHIQDLVRDPSDVLVLNPVEPRDEMVDQQRDVLSAVAEGW
jgi:hypothetical protein